MRKTLRSIDAVMYILAHDLGTSGNKATLFSSDGRILESAFTPYESFYGPNGEAEQEPEDWWSAVISSTRKLLTIRPDAATKTAAIGFSGHMMGCLALDGDGNAMGRAWLHSDIRSTKQSARLSDAMGAKTFFDITGNPADPHYPFSKIMWLKENCPELYSKAACFVQSKDYIVGRLTGKYGVTDFTDASLTGFFDINKRCWSEEILDASGINSSKMPEILESSTVVGGISRSAAEATGLMQGIPVVAGGGDGACAAVGAAATEPGDAYNYIGSTSWISAITKEPLLDEQMRLFVLCNLDASTYSVLGTVQSAGTSYEWASNSLCEQESTQAPKDGTSKFKLMDDLARLAPAGSDMLIFLPYLMGERAPIWDSDARGVYFGLSINHSRAHLVRAVLEGVAYALRSIIDVIEDSDSSINSVTTIGGGAEGRLWREILASVFGRTIITPEHLREATSYGAAIAAGIGIGLFDNYSVAKKLVGIREEVEPDTSIEKVYGRCYTVFRELYPALKENFASLAALRAEI